MQAFFLSVPSAYLLLLSRGCQHPHARRALALIMAVPMVCTAPLDTAIVRDGLWSFGLVQMLNVVVGMVSISLAAVGDPRECSASATRPSPEWAARDTGLRCRRLRAAHPVRVTATSARARGGCPTASPTARAARAAPPRSH